MAGASGSKPALEHPEPGERDRSPVPDGVHDDVEQGVDGGHGGAPVVAVS
jgi:hypothetical protein